MRPHISIMSTSHVEVATKEIRRLARAFATGNLGARGELSEATGSARELLEAVNELLDSAISPITGLRNGIEYVATEHAKGDIDINLRPTDFHGDFALIAKMVNELVDSHISVKKKAMSCVKAFADGDFNAVFEPLPGKKAFINETIEQLRGNLRGLVIELNHMSAEHDKGDIDVIVPVEKFNGDFAAMAHGLNEMVANHIAAKKMAMACIKQFGEGNFSAPMQHLPGKKAFINDTIELLRTNLKAIMSEIRRLIDASAAGRLEERGNAADFDGDFSQVILGINGMLDAILHPIAEGNRILDKVSTGDLTERVEIACEGDHRRMKDAINNLVDSLTQFANNVGTAADQVAIGSQELSNGAETLSQGAVEQASSTEEASMLIATEK